MKDLSKEPSDEISFASASLVTMATRRLPQREMRLVRTLIAVAAVTVGMIALAVLGGWILNNRWLTGGLPGKTPMNPFTAIAFLLCSAALWLQWDQTERAWARGSATALGLLVAGLGLVKTLGYLTGWDTGWDLLLFTRPAGETHLPPPIAPNTALNFLLLGTALALLHREQGIHPGVRTVLALGALAIAAVALCGYAYAVLDLYDLAQQAPMALTTAVAFTVLSLGVLSARPEAGPMVLLLSASAGGAAARRLLPVVVFLPLVLGLLRLAGQRAGLYNLEVGVAILVVVTSACLLGVCWWNACLLHRADEERTLALEALQTTRDELERRVAERTADLTGLNQALQAEIENSQRQARRLAESEEAFRLLSQGAQDLGLYMLDTDGNVVTWNATAERIKGYKATEILGKPHACCYTEEDCQAGKPEQHLKIAASVGQVDDVGWRVRKNGERYWAAMTMTALRDETGQLRGFTKVTRDHTERWEAAERLQQQLRLMRLRADVGSALATSADFEGALQHCAEALVGHLDVAFARIWLLNQADNTLELRASAGLYTHLDGAHSRIPMGQLKIGSIAQDRQPHLTNAVIGDPRVSDQDWAARERMVAFAGYPLMVDGQVLGVLAMFSRSTLTNDVFTEVASVGQTIAQYVQRHRTEGALQRTEQQLVQAQKMDAIGRLAGGVAHDFNNMLAVINGYSELLLFRSDLEPKMRQMLEEIQRAGERAVGLTRQLLAFSRKQMVTPQRLDLNQAVRDIHSMLRRVIGEDIELVTVTDPVSTPVLMDPSQVEQILMNLAVNARDAMPQGGKLTIETKNVELDGAFTREHIRVEPGPYVLLAVTDSGYGMDQETQRRIFEPFFTTKAPGEGTGLGLATVYAIVQQSGGHLWVYSEPEQGTSFKIYLPRSGAADLDQEADAAPVLPRGTETVLLVEDEEMVRAVARNVLELCGYTVLEAAHGHEALRLYQQYDGQIDLLLSDVVMPQMSGRELVERLRVLCPRAKVLFMSGYTEDAVVRHGVLSAQVAFIEKPFTAVALAKKIREVLQPAGEG